MQLDAGRRRRHEAGDPLGRPALGVDSQKQHLDARQHLRLEGVERAQEDANAFPLAELPEERDPAHGLTGLGPDRLLLERARLADVLDHPGRFGDRPAVRAHPVEQPFARADHGVRECDRRALRDFLSEAGQPVGHLSSELGEDPARAVAVRDEGRLRQGQSEPACLECREGQGPPVVHDHHLRRTLSQRVVDLEGRCEVRRLDPGSRLQHS